MNSTANLWNTNGKESTNTHDSEFKTSPIPSDTACNPVLTLVGPGSDAREHDLGSSMEAKNETGMLDPLLSLVLNSKEDEIVSIARLEKMAILRALKITSGNINVAAKELGIGRATLYRRLATYGDVDVLSFKNTSEAE